jgi:hypothetical protein
MSRTEGNSYRLVLGDVFQKEERWNEKGITIFERISGRLNTQDHDYQKSKDFCFAELKYYGGRENGTFGIHLSRN